MQQRFTLKAHERLKSRKIIQQLFKEGKSFSNFPLRVIFLETENQLSCLQAGFSVSTRHFKKAVDRNRIKRIMRESYRLQKNSLQIELEENHKNLAVFFIYTGKELPEYFMVFEKTRNAIRQLEGSIR
ncbi:MAG: ribonuclease P protein component [Bacteroidota bacterium]|nr:ribonuclease P protein component [Bacteroidota bacterium]